MPNDEVTIGGESFKRLDRAVARSENEPVGPDIGKARPQFRSANWQFVQPTGPAANHNGTWYWPGKVKLRTEANQTWKELGDVWIMDADSAAIGDTLEVGTYYEAVQAGPQTLMGLKRPTFITNVICCGDGPPPPGPCTVVCHCANGNFTGFPFVVRLVSCDAFVPPLTFNGVEKLFTTFNDLIDSNLCDLGTHNFNVTFETFPNERVRLNVHIVSCQIEVSCYYEITTNGGQNWQQNICSSGHQMVINGCNVTAGFGTFTLLGVFNFCTIIGGQAWTIYIGPP